jgi:uncharacterized Fe-S radical SAM superfamily protein PflX
VFSVLASVKSIGWLGKQAYVVPGVWYEVSFGPHFSEEQPLVGSHGSGAIFLSSCRLSCCFCQNYDISHHPNLDEEVDTQQKGCHNINLITPSHAVPQIISAIVLAVEGGLDISVVYNTSGYDSIQTLELLDGVIDIYMPDFQEALVFAKHAGLTRIDQLDVASIISSLNMI